ncbi:MAG: DUF2752 domain-containing protein [Fulvivirga sp.]|nr:DUF2752 domain-containing protein [Fulvivirga sp.]
MKKAWQFIWSNREAFIWATGLIFLASIDPEQATHVSICPLKIAEFDHCPGCGLGRSIAFLFKGEITHSFNTHPLGMVALAILLYRIIYLFITNLKLKRS